MNIMGGSTLGSGASILRSLTYAPRMLIMADEIGDLIRAMKTQNSYSQDLPRVLKELFSACGRPYMKRYADSKKDIQLNWHHLSVYACGVPEPFWDSLTYDDVSDGFIPRCLIVESTAEAPLPKAIIRHEIPSSVINAFSRWTHDDRTQDGDITAVPIPREVPFDPPAFAYHDEKMRHYHDLRNKFRQETDGKGALYGRIAEHVAKVALIVECGMAEGLPFFISLDATRWAWDYCENIVNYIASRIENHISVNDHDHKVNKIVELVRTNTENGKRTTTKDLYKMAALRGVDHKRMNAYVNMAIEQERIEAIDYKPIGRGRSGKEFRLCK